MHLKSYAIFTIVLLTLGVSTLLALEPVLVDSPETPATIYGATCKGDTFELLLNNVTIDVTSIPPQPKIVKDDIIVENGTFSFELMPGEYIVTAMYYQNNTPTYSTQKIVKAESGTEYSLLVLLDPVSETKNTTTIDEIETIKTDAVETKTVNIYLRTALLLILVGGGYTLYRKYKLTEKNRLQEGKEAHLTGHDFEFVNGSSANVFSKSIVSEVSQELVNFEVNASITEPITAPADNFEIETIDLKKFPLSIDLQKTMDVIRGHKGRIAQKDLRSKLKYSEVKVSLLLSELERRGLVKKLKNGRQNIVILMDQES